LQQHFVLHIPVMRSVPFFPLAVLLAVAFGGGMLADAARADVGAELLSEARTDAHTGGAADAELARHQRGGRQLKGSKPKSQKPKSSKKPKKPKKLKKFSYAEDPSIEDRNLWDGTWDLCTSDWYAENGVAHRRPGTSTVRRHCEDNVDPIRTRGQISFDFVNATQEIGRTYETEPRPWAAMKATMLTVGRGPREGRATTQNFIGVLGNLQTNYVSLVSAGPLSVRNGTDMRENWVMDYLNCEIFMGPVMQCKFSGAEIFPPGLNRTGRNTEVGERHTIAATLVYVAGGATCPKPPVGFCYDGSIPPSSAPSSAPSPLPSGEPTRNPSAPSPSISPTPMPTKAPSKAPNPAP